MKTCTSWPSAITAETQILLTKLRWKNKVGASQNQYSTCQCWVGGFFGVLEHILGVCSEAAQRGGVWSCGPVPFMFSVAGCKWPQHEFIGSYVGRAHAQARRTSVFANSSSFQHSLHTAAEIKPTKAKTPWRTRYLWHLALQEVTNENKMKIHTGGKYPEGIGSAGKDKSWA